eukprot:5446442-Amphidinium_carterae.1
MEMNGMSEVGMCCMLCASAKRAEGSLCLAAEQDGLLHTQACRALGDIQLAVAQWQCAAAQISKFGAVQNAGSWVPPKHLGVPIQVAWTCWPQS